MEGSSVDWVLEKMAAKKPPSAIAPPPTVDKKIKKEPDRKYELELFHAWNNNGRKPEHLEPLLKSFQPLIQKRINIFKNKVEVPTAAIEMAHKKAFVDALKTYDPKRGTQLNTWVTTNLKQVQRFIGERQNFARITENISRHIGSFNAAKAELTEQLGYEPSAQDIHDHIIEMAHPKLAKLSMKDIKRLNEEQRRSLIDKGHDIIGGSEDFSTREEEVIHLIVPQLTKEERKVHELTFGLNGNAPHTPGQIVKKLKMDGPKVSKLRTSIFKKMKPHLSME